MAIDTVRPSPFTSRPSSPFFSRFTGGHRDAHAHAHAPGHGRAPDEPDVSREIWRELPN